MSEIISWGMRFNPSALSCAEAPGAVALGVGDGWMPEWGDERVLGDHLGQDNRWDLEEEEQGFIRSMRCLILAGKWWGKQCKAIKGPQAPSKVSHFCLVEANRWAVAGSGVVLPGPSQKGAMVQCVEYGTGMLELFCSWLLCWLLPGGSQATSFILSPTSCLFCLKNKLGGQGLSLPMHMHSTTGCNLSGA